MDPDPFAPSTAQSPTHADLHSALEAVADATLVVDNHAHPFWIPDPAHLPPNYQMPNLATVLCESTTQQLNSRASLAFCRSLRDLHALIISDAPRPSSVASWRDSSGPESTHDEDNSISHQAPDHVVRDHGLDIPTETEHAIEAMRAEMGPWNLAKRCFGAAGIAAVLIDDGLPCPPGTLPVQISDFSARLNVPVARRVLRLETEAELALADIVIDNRDHIWYPRPRAQGGVGHSPDKRPRTTLRAQMFRNAFRDRLHPLPKDVVSFKSIAAYRSGLGVRLDWTDYDLEDALSRLSFSAIISASSSSRHRPRIRLEDPIIIDCIVRAGLEAAREHSIPIQFHCGLGDTDMDIAKANPVLLRSIFQQFPDVRIVLLHGAWPFTRDAAYLTAVYPKVYLDLGLAIPLLSVRGMFRMVDEALELAPITKLLYSSDAHSVPDIFYLAARWGRRVIAAVIAASVVSGDLAQAEAKAAVRKILAENAVRLYNLPVLV